MFGEDVLGPLGSWPGPPGPISAALLAGTSPRISLGPEIRPDITASSEDGRWGPG